MSVSTGRISRDTGFQSLIDLTIFCVKSLISINGGAIVILLAFTGNIVNKGIEYPQEMSCALLWYFLGITSAVLEVMFVYAFQVFEIEGGARFPSLWRKREWFRFLAVALAILSLVFFTLGSLKAVCAFKTISTVHHQRKCD